MKIYQVKMTVEKGYNAECGHYDESHDEVIYASLSYEKAEEVADTYGIKAFMWIEELVLDSVYGEFLEN